MLDAKHDLSLPVKSKRPVPAGMVNVPIAYVQWIALMLVGVGIVAGVALVLPAGRLAGALLYGLSARDPRTLILASALVLATGLLVGALPAWRASRVDPTRALRAD